jgi:hypothetical protein
VKFTLLVLVAVLLAACGSKQPAAGPATSLVKGTVAAGPTSPLSQPGVSDTAVVQGATVDALSGNQVIATTRSDQAGRYQFRLPPGTYVIRALSDKYLSKEKDATVTLTQGQQLTVNLVFDTGIR